MLMLGQQIKVFASITILKTQTQHYVLINPATGLLMKLENIECQVYTFISLLTSMYVL